MSFKQSPAHNVLVKKYEGMSNENSVEIIEYRNQYYKETEKEAKGQEWEGKLSKIFTPTETGLHRLNVYCEGHVINGCPASFKVMADRSKVTLNMADSCSLGALTDLQVNSATAGDNDVQIQVHAPSGRSQNLAVPRHGGNYVLSFNPTEVGTYIIQECQNKRKLHYTQIT